MCMYVCMCVCEAFLMFCISSFMYGLLAHTYFFVYIMCVTSQGTHIEGLCMNKYIYIYIYINMKYIYISTHIFLSK